MKKKLLSEDIKVAGGKVALERFFTLIDIIMILIGFELIRGVFS